MYEWNFALVWRNIDPILRGAAVTLQLTALTIVVGLPVAAITAAARRARYRPARLLALTFIEIFRDLPVLVVLVWMYYCLPLVTGGRVQPSALVIATTGLALNFAAIEAEIIRSGAGAITRQEIESAQSFGFSRGAILLHVVLPQVFWRTLPPTIGQAANTLKLSALASFIAVPEAFFATLTLIQDTARPLEFYTILAAVYLAIILPVSLSATFLERAFAERFRWGA